jgi:hypothetical protein
MGIIHTAKKHIMDELVKKKRLRLLETLRTRNVNITNLPTKDEIKVSSLIALANSLCVVGFLSLGLAVHPTYAQDMLKLWHNLSCKY